MAIPNIILSKPYLLVRLEDSPQQILAYNNTDFVFAYVEDIYDTCDTVNVGDYVYFDLSKALGITYSAINYYLIQDTFKIFNEQYSPPL